MVPSGQVDKAVFPCLGVAEKGQFVAVQVAEIANINAAAAARARIAFIRPTQLQRFRMKLGDRLHIVDPDRLW